MKRIQVGSTSYSILEILGIVGLVAIGSLLNPTLPYKILKKAAREWSRPRVRTSLWHLERGGLVKKDAKETVSLTKAGRKALERLRLDALKITRPARWDKKWHLVLFDIPAYPKTFNNARDALRGMLKRLGFVPIQKSVWIHPFPCETEVEALAAFFGVQQYVRMARVDQIEDESKLRARFGL